MFRIQVIPASTPNLASAAQRLVDTLLLWQERSRQRQHLATLDARMLGDMGLSRSDVVSEVAKPFWRA